MTVAPERAIETGVLAEQLFTEQQQTLHVKTDRIFAGLLVLQWIAEIIVAKLITPGPWVSQYYSPNFHFQLAVGLGLLIISLPLLLTWFTPGKPLTRYSIGVAQALTGSLLVHLCNGRIETHFHFFVSLAILAVYRDWKVILSATLAIAVDHFLRGIWLPQSVFGVLNPGKWRWFEHALWVVFEDTFLIRACVYQIGEMKSLAQRQAETQIMSRSLQDLLEQIQKNTSYVATSSEELLATYQLLETKAKQIDSDSEQASSATSQMNRNIKNVASGIQEGAAHIESVLISAQVIESSIECIHQEASVSKINTQAIAEDTNSISQALGRMTDAASQMHSALVQVCDKANNTLQVTAEAKSTANGVQKNVEILTESTHSIVEFVEIIKQIADQTNLLALNAAIEAASVGEAGKGFAIVANEVKELAKASSSASENICSVVSRIQNDNVAVRSAIVNISRIIEQIYMANNAIAKAVFEQTEVASVISDSVSTVAETTQDINHKVQGGRVSAEKLATELENTSQGIQNIRSTIEKLNDNVQVIAENASMIEGTGIVSSIVQVKATAGQVMEQSAKTKVNAEALSQQAQSLRQIAQKMAVTNSAN